MMHACTDICFTVTTDAVLLVHCMVHVQVLTFIFLVCQRHIVGFSEGILFVVF